MLRWKGQVQISQLNLILQSPCQMGLLLHSLTHSLIHPFTHSRNILNADYVPRPVRGHSNQWHKHNTCRMVSRGHGKETQLNDRTHVLVIL